MHTMEELRQKQSLPLDIKVRMTQNRVKQWVDQWGVDGVYVSFSGGKDSTVLLHIVRQLYPDVPAVFVDTGLEYPEIREFVKTFNNVEWLKPKMNFRKVIETYGYPFISKEVSHAVHNVRVQSQKNNIPITECSLWHRKFDPKDEHNVKFPRFVLARWDFLNYSPYKISHNCCHIMKKNPSKKYEKETGRKPFIATMASESMARQTTWLEQGCNAFEAKRPTSKPMSFWTEQDVLHYLKDKGIPLASVYGDIVIDYKGECEGQMDFCDYGLAEDKRPLKTTGCDRTGCMFCGFGCHQDEAGNGRFEMMKITHPKQYEYIMKPWEMGGLDYKNVIDWINEHGNLNIKY